MDVTLMNKTIINFNVNEIGYMKFKPKHPPPQKKTSNNKHTNNGINAQFLNMFSAPFKCILFIWPNLDIYRALVSM